MSNSIPPVPIPHMSTLKAEGEVAPISLLSTIARTPYPSWITSAILLGAVPACVRLPLGYPHLVQLPVFAAIFGGSGYMLKAGDPVNGSGTTCAWSLTFLFLSARKAVVSKRPGPIFVSGAVAANALIYGMEYFLNSD